MDDDLEMELLATLTDDGDQDGVPVELFNERDADIAIWLVDRAEREKARIEAFAAARVAEINAFAKARLAVQQGIIDNGERALEGWARMNHERAGGEGKGPVTWKFRRATLKLLPAQHSLVVTNNALAAKTLIDLDEPGLIEQEPTVRAGELKKLVVGSSRREGSALRLRLENEDPTEWEGDPAATPDVGVEHDPDDSHYDVILSGMVIPGVEVKLPRRRKFKRTPTSKGAADDEG